MIETLIIIALVSPIVLFIGKKITNKVAEFKAKKYINGALPNDFSLDDKEKQKKLPKNQENSDNIDDCIKEKEIKEGQPQQNIETLNTNFEHTSRYSTNDITNRANIVDNFSVNQNDETSNLINKQDEIVPTPHFKDAEEPITIIDENIL